MDDIYENIEEYHPCKERKVLIESSKEMRPTNWK